MLSLFFSLFLLDLFNNYSFIIETLPSQSIPRVPLKETVDSIMDLYGHVLVAHTAGFYEKMDFKNASAERGEGYLAYMKKREREKEVMREEVLKEKKT